MALVALVAGHGGGTATDRASAQRALIPLSDLPGGTGTAANPPEGANGCVTPTAAVVAQQWLQPPTGPSVGEELEVDTQHGSSALLRDARTQFDCARSSFKNDEGGVTGFNVLSLAFPQLNTDQGAWQLVDQGLVTSTVLDVIVVPVNSSSALVMIFQSQNSPPDLSTAEAFTRTALGRARSTLGT